MSKPRQPNVTRIAHGMYIVRTQAGFRKAIKDACFSDIHVSETDNYPKVYPSLVSITNGYKGSWYPQVRCIALDDLKDKLREQAELF